MYLWEYRKENGRLFQNLFSPTYWDQHPKCCRISLNLVGYFKLRHPINEDDPVNRQKQEETRSNFFSTVNEISGPVHTSIRYLRCQFEMEIIWITEVSKHMDSSGKCVDVFILQRWFGSIHRKKSQIYHWCCLHSKLAYRFFSIEFHGDCMSIINGM